jgi:hypothetical protein
MTTSDVDRLYNGLAEVTAEVRGYRSDLNGRLKALEVAEAKRQGAGEARGSLGRFIWGVAAVSAAIGSIVGVIATIL